MNPELNCSVIEELSAAAAVIVVLFGFVHLNTRTTPCVAEGVALVTVYVMILPTQGVLDPVKEVGVGGT